MYEDNFLSSWLRVDGKGKTKREMEVEKEVKEDEGKNGKRVRVKGEDETVVKRKCVNPVSVEALDIFSQGEFSVCDSCGVNSDCRSGTWSSTFVSNDIRVPPSFAVEVVGDGEQSVFCWEFGSE